MKLKFIGVVIVISAIDLGKRSQETFNSASSEIEYRCCVRTAYYSLFHYSKAIADSIPGGYNQSLGHHERIISKLLNSDDENHKKLGVELSRYRSCRVKADYRIDKSFTKSEAYKVIRFIEKTFSI